MGIELRELKSDELRRFLETTEAAFGATVTDEEVARLTRIIEPDRMLCAVDDDAIVGTAGAFRFTVSVPGAELAAAAVTMVGVLPSHRRQGILTRMMRHQLHQAREWNEPVAVLWASEGAIYQRFGYGLATRQAFMDIERDRAVFRDVRIPSGRVRLLSFDEATKVLPEVYDRVRRAVPGMMSRTHEWWEAHRLADPEDHRRGGPMFRAVLEIEGIADAYALYRTHPSWGRDGVPETWLEVIEVVATSPVATREIWSFLFGIDLVARVKASFLASDDPLQLMLAEMGRLRFQLSDALWLRIVDVAGALSARSYATEDSITVELSDSFCLWNEGRWRLDAGYDGARVQRTPDPAQLALDAGDLGAAYLGGATFGELARAGRVNELEPGALRRADALFVTERAPWCVEIF
jgi:predicted acetyltransferase